MFRKVLVPLDMTFKHRRAVDTAIELIQRSGGEAVLLHVIEMLHGMPRSEEQEFYDRLETAAQTHVERHLVLFKEKEVPCRKEIRFGVRAAEVLRLAQSMDADLIILTAPRIDPQDPADSWGSLSYKLGFLAPCPVLLVK